MQFSVDTAVVAEIKELNDYGLLDGVTTTILRLRSLLRRSDLPTTSRTPPWRAQMSRRSLRMSSRVLPTMC